ncbi:hypothetical protein Cni_G16961 [Canna indica]|uniref:Uncharacterized protein n=1 Tax=Canna indica TaxID=4628 RepID=A0AAQ3KGW8_9LILI|nr:hypothetical protein Cni_G16961 [Canna indica]
MEKSVEQLHRKLTDTFAVAVNKIKEARHSITDEMEAYEYNESQSKDSKEAHSIVKNLFNSENNSCTDMNAFEETLSTLDTKLVKWDKEMIGSLEKSLKDTLDELRIFEEIDDKGLSSEHDQIHMNSLVNKSMALNRQIHIKWWSKERTLWLEQNDKNTRVLPFLNRKSNLWSELLNARNAGFHPWNDKQLMKSSWASKSLLLAIIKLRHGLIKKVGNGMGVNLQNDPWIDSIPISK